MQNFKYSLTKIIVSVGMLQSIVSCSIQAPTVPYVQPSDKNGQSQPDKIVASYISSGGDSDKIGTIPGEHLTHLLYAFAVPCGSHPKADAEVQMNFNTMCENKPPFSVFLPEAYMRTTDMVALQSLKQKHPHLKFLLSIGGWSYSGPFHDLVKTDEGLNSFATSAVQMMEKYPVFDGLDIDWEFPGGDDNTHPALGKQGIARERIAFTKMMKKLRAELDVLQVNETKKYSLSTAMTGSPSNNTALNWRGVAPYIDYLFLMTYDFAVGDKRAGHHASFYPPDANSSGVISRVEDVISHGVPSSKIILGVPFYGRGWSNVSWSAQDGIQERASSKAEIPMGYRDLMASHYIRKNYVKQYDVDLGVSFLVNEKEGKLISFDDAEIIKMKAKWAKNQGLGGIFSWQIGHDSSDYALTQAMTAIRD